MNKSTGATTPLEQLGKVTISSRRLRRIVSNIPNLSSYQLNKSTGVLL